MNGIQEKQKLESVQNVNQLGGTRKRNDDYYWRNRDYWREYKHQHYLDNKEMYKERSKKWTIENKEQSKAIKQKYIINNKFSRMITVKMGDIKDRCTNKNNVHFKFYGGKDIKCYLTRDNLIFLWKRDNAHLLKRASIDRKDSNGNYTIDNCRFIEHYENSMEGLSKTPTHRKHKEKSTWNIYLEQC